MSELIRSQKMKRDIWLVADNPAIVPRRNEKQFARAQFDFGAIIHYDLHTSRHNQADVFNLAG